MKLRSGYVNLFFLSSHLSRQTLHTCFRFIEDGSSTIHDPAYSFRHTQNLKRLVLVSAFECVSADQGVGICERLYELVSTNTSVFSALDNCLLGEEVDIDDRVGSSAGARVAIRIQRVR
jgi:hypothetical protein